MGPRGEVKKKKKKKRTCGKHLKKCLTLGRGSVGTGALVSVIFNILQDRRKAPSRARGSLICTGAFQNSDSYKTTPPVHFP